MFLRQENSSLTFFTLPPIFLSINFTILVVTGKKIVSSRAKKKRKIVLEILPSLLARFSKAVTLSSSFWEDSGQQTALLASNSDFR